MSSGDRRVVVGARDGEPAARARFPLLIRSAILVAVLAAMRATGPPWLSGQMLEKSQPAIGPAETLRSMGDLRPGDIVKVRIWRETDLSGEFPVNEQGEVVLPRLGPLSVRGVSLDSLKTKLLAEYSTYLRNPAIELTLLRRVRVTGAVQKPGLYPVDPTMTVGDALALAGGATPQGKQEVELRRGQEQVQIKVDKQTRLADTPMRSGDELYVPERSWLSRNAGMVVGAVTVIAGLVVSVNR